MKLTYKGIIFCFIIIFASVTFLNKLCSYDYLGQRWRTPKMPISYFINTAGAPAYAVSAIQSAFQTWQSASNSYISFQNGGTGDYTFQVDSINSLSWGYAYGGLAASSNWLIDDDLVTIREKDIVFSDTASWSATDIPQSGCYDLQSIATHEIGHWLRLGDLYGANDIEKTMYGYAIPEETKKRTLDQDDIDGVIFIYSKIRVPKDYDNIKTALDNALTGQTVVVSSGNYSITQDITVPSGVTLQITDPPTTLSFSSGKSLIVYGTLNASGGAAQYRIFFTGSSWGGIKLYSSNSYMHACKVENASCGIYVESCSPTINYSWIQHCYNGIYAWGALVTLDVCTIDSNTQRGVYAFNGANVNMGYDKENVITQNNYGVEAYFDATIYAHQGNNSIFNNRVSGGYEAVATSGGYVSGNQNYWGQCPIQSSWFYQGLGGTITYADSLCSNPNSGRSLTKIISSPITVKREGIQSSKRFSISSDDELNQIYILWDRKEYNAVVDKCKTILEQPDQISTMSYNILSFLRFASQEIEQSDIETYLQNITAKYENKEICGIALLNNVQYLMFKNRYQEALDKIDLVVNKYENSNIEKMALSQKILILYNHLKDDKKGDEELANFENKYPNDGLTNDLRLLTNRPNMPGYSIKSSQHTTGNFIEISNYPNPFNPTTNIVYQVKENGHTKLVIHNILGQLIKTLVDEEMSPGKYQTVWDGKDNAGNTCSSGLYFCTILSGKHKESMKLYLQK